MVTIDAQVHAYERDHPGRPWHAVLHGPGEVTGAEMVEAMDAVAVDAAILVSPWTMYRFDASYAQDVYAAHPGRFAIVKPVDPTDPAVAETIADWAKVDGAIGIRIMMVGDVSEDPADPGINRVLSAAAEHNLPVNLLCWGRTSQGIAIAARNPNTRIVIDHLGLKQPFEPPVPDEPFGELSNVLKLAEHENVVIKITGACTLSKEPFPHRDIREPVGRIIDAFGLERCLWGTDWTRAVELITYEDGVTSFRQADWFSDSDRTALMGGNLQRVYNWVPGTT